MKIEWNEINSVNVKEIDEQHKKLIGIINRFFGSDPADKASLMAILKEGTDYANYHLSVEEDYFVKFQYDKAEEHKKQHDFYRAKIAEFMIELQTEATAQVFAEMSEFLRNWWIHHINSSDQEYSECFNKHGLY